ncbi:glycosyltransferase [Patescibacteria group bacterium]|nr:glycosyltransferase [Patescibacteria group bacterium]
MQSVGAKKRVLLVYAVPYSGHAQAAAALHAALLNTQEVEVEEYHFLQQFKYTGAAVVQFYKWILTNLPSVWGHVHNNSDYRGLSDALIHAMQEWDILGLLKRVEQWKPDVIVAIQAFPLRILGEAKQQGRLTVPLMVVTTDFWAHQYWAHPAVDCYFVANDRVKRDLMQQKIQEKRIIRTGIPLRPVFEKQLPSKRAARIQLGWSMKDKVVLCMGGSYGFVPFEELMTQCRRSPPKEGERWVFLFGNNKKGFEEAEKALAASTVQEHVRLYGFREDVEVFMRASDVFITKPGGLSVSEALVCHLPLILYKPLPGQEQKNATYLVRAGLAKKVGTVSQAVREVRHFFEEKTTSRQSPSSRKDAQPRAATKIARTIVQKLV